MQKLREATVILLMLFLLAGILYIIYSLLIWQVLPRALGVALLFALALLKGIIVVSQNHRAAISLNCEDTRLLKFTLLCICSIFLVVVYISFLLKSLQAAAWIIFGLCSFTVIKALKFLPA